MDISFLLTFHLQTKNQLHMKKTSILCLALLSFLFSQSQIRYLKGNFQGSQEVPANAATGSGVVIVKYNMGTKALELYGNYSGLTSAITGSHIHRGEPSVAGPVVIALVNSGDTTGTLSLTATLTQPQEDSLLAGNMYANVHTATYSAGEIRARLTMATDLQTDFLSGRLQGAQAVPPTSSAATGAVYALVDRGTDSVFVTGSYTGLTTASNAAHVHLENPGTEGNVLFPVSHSSSAAGTVHAMAAVTAAQASLISSGGSYVNIHTSTYPAGEIRAQLINNTTVRYLAGELAGSNEVPANSSAARGTVIVVYNTETNYLQLAGDFQKLSDTITAAHIHPGGPAATNPPIIPLTVTPLDSTGTMTATATLTTDQETDLLAGNMYVNVHSKSFPNGEIRTQLIATASGETSLFAVNLTEQQVRPNTAGTAKGNALIIVDKTTGLTYVTGAFEGINSNVTTAHVHRGPVGETGPAILPLTIVQRFAVPHSGTFSGSGTLAPSSVDSMINGLTYVDVHSSFYSEGAIRAQLGDLVLPVTLTYLNAYKQRNEIGLIWETAEERNVSRYEIEQLNTATQKWTTKGTVFAKGGSSAATYTYTDAPNLYGNKYLIYRLKIIDKDGKFSYSPLVKVNFEKLKAELFIQTNPVVNGELKYMITGLATGKKAEVSIIDYNGRLLLKNTISSLFNNTLRIPQLSAGMYKLIIRIDDTILQKSFIK